MEPRGLVPNLQGLPIQCKKRHGCGWGIRRLAENILNKQLWTADQEWASSLGVWRKTPRTIKTIFVEKRHTVLGTRLQ